MASAMPEMEQRHAYSIQACLEYHLLRPRGLVDLQVPDGKFLVDRSALEC
jgi:hypothetical protein